MLFDEHTELPVPPTDYQPDPDEILEVSPCSRFRKFNEHTGTSSWRSCHRAYDCETGRQVSWNTISLFGLNAAERKLLLRRMRLYRMLRHRNFVAVIKTWVDHKKLQLVYISELVSGTSLSRFFMDQGSHLTKIRPPKLKIVKDWCVQLLEALHYYHETTNEGAFLYLRCSQIMVEANTNQLKLSEESFICDAIKLCKSAYFGSPQWIPPEMEHWNMGGHTDVYCFGMVLLAVLTNLKPYGECKNPVEVYKLMGSGVLPPEIEEVADVELKNLVLQCLGPYEQRPSIKELLGLEVWKHTKSHTELAPLEPEHLGKCRSLDGSFVTVLSSGSERPSMTNLSHTITLGNQQTVTVTFQAPQLGLKCFKFQADNLPNFGTLFQDIVSFVENVMAKGTSKERHFEEQDLTGKDGLQTLLNDAVIGYQKTVGGKLKERGQLVKHLLNKLKHSAKNETVNSAVAINDTATSHTPLQQSVSLDAAKLPPSRSLIYRTTSHQPITGPKPSPLVDTQRNDILVDKLFQPRPSKHVSFTDAVQNEQSWTDPQNGRKSFMLEPATNETPGIYISSQISPIKQKQTEVTSPGSFQQMEQQRSVLSSILTARRVPSLPPKPNRRLLLYDVTKH